MSEELIVKPETEDQICAADCLACAAGDKFFPRNFPPHKKWVALTDYCDKPEHPAPEPVTSNASPDLSLTNSSAVKPDTAA